jgi:aminopeptidase N
MKLLNVNSYQKGAWVLHMLRYEMGDDLFWKGMRLYYEDFRNKNALTNDFKMVMESVSNNNLGKFFDQWLFTAGQPDLKITVNESTENGFKDLVIEQTQDYLFNFDIDIQIKDSKGSYILTIPVSDRVTGKTLRTEKISEIIPDPNTNLLFRMVPDQSNLIRMPVVSKTE